VIRNAGEPPIKTSHVEVKNNLFVKYVFSLQMLVCFIVASVSTGLNNSDSIRNAWYVTPALTLGGSGQQASNWFVSFFTNILLFQDILPISIYVSLDVVKTIQARMIQWDRVMYYPEADKPAVSKTSTLNEELGQIEYVFSDKTGTLTCNQMKFRCVSCFGRVFGKVALSSPQDAGIDLSLVPKNLHQHVNKYSSFDTSATSAVMTGADRSAQPLQVALLKRFAVALALCHNLGIEASADADASIEYRAESPDEAALAAGAAQLGVVFAGRKQNRVMLKEFGRDRVYTLELTVPFDSDRKRMTVLVRADDGSYIVFTKGADTIMFPLLAPHSIGSEQDALLHATIGHLNDFSSIGLRTLVFAYRVLSPEQGASLAERWVAASATMGDRAGALAAVALDIERDLLLCAASAVEDRLQDNVADTLVSLMEADMKVWMLTGDKQETAINIAYSCGLFQDYMDMMVIDGADKAKVTEQIHNAMEKSKTYKKRSSTVDTRAQSNEAMEQRSLKEQRMSVDGSFAGKQAAFCLVIPGPSLALVLGSDLQPDFLTVCTRCQAVVACRVSPMQKALVVKMVKIGLGKVCLSIGDGANDVPMIQAAHIGVGISGFEGLQAVMASDFAIAQFQFLKRLLLVHGRWSYRRVSKLIFYIFYKCLAYAFIQFFFSFFNAWSGQPCFNLLMMQLYNVMFTALPCLVFAIFDKDADDKVSMQHPELYRLGVEDGIFTRVAMLSWMVSGVYHSAIIFFFGYYMFAFGGTPFESGLDGDLSQFGVLTFFVLVLVTNTRAGMIATTWTWLMPASLLASVLSFLIVAFIVGAIALSLGPLATPFYLALASSMTSARFWLCGVIAVTIALLRDYVWRAHVRLHNPSEVLKRQIAEKKLEKKRKLAAERKETYKIEKEATARPTIIRSGFAFDAPTRLNSRGQEYSVSGGLL